MSKLDERIAAAFSADQKSETVAALIQETELGLADANKAAEEARARALDPTLTAKEAADARRNMEDAAFARDRLQAALPRLNERLRELEASEEDARRWSYYKKVEAERDDIAKELAEYSALAKRIAAIVERLAKNDAAIDRLNAHALPTRASKLRSAELIARGLSSFSPAPYVTIPRIGQETRLVRFEHDKSDPYLWPRPAPSIAMSVHKGLFKLPASEPEIDKDVKVAV